MPIIDRSGGVVAAGNPTMTDRRTGIVAGIACKAPCRAASTAALTLSGPQTVDGVACVAGDRVLVKDQASSAANGVYVVSSGPWTRATDFDSVDEIARGTLVFVASEGSSYANSLWFVTSADPTTIDSSAITFSNLTVVLVGSPSLTGLQLTSTDAGAAVGPSFDIYRNSASPAASDIIGSIDFNGRDSAANKQLYARLVAQISDPTTTTEDAILLLQAVVNGTLTTLLQTSATGTTAPQAFDVTGVLSENATSHGIMARGTTAQRSGTTAGQHRFNSTLVAPEFHDGGAWRPYGAQPVAGGFKALSITNNAGTPNTKIDLAADAVTVETTSGIAYRLTSLAKTIDCSVNGADGLDTGALANSTWYSVWAIYNPTTNTMAGLASTSATAPTMPSGYTAKARLGWMITNGSAQLKRTLQYGRRAQYIIGTNPTVIPGIAAGAAGTFSSTSPTLTTASVTVVVPPTASVIFLNVTANWEAGANSNVLVAPNTSWGGTNKGPTGSSGQMWPFWINTTFTNGAQQVELLLEGDTIAWCSSAAGGAIGCLGWEDNI